MVGFPLMSPVVTPEERLFANEAPHENIGASTANLSIRSIYVVVNTNLAACGGGIGWTLLEYMYTQKFSIIGFCSGIISGLVGITPAAGFGMSYCFPPPFFPSDLPSQGGRCVCR